MTEISYGKLKIHALPAESRSLLPDDWSEKPCGTYFTPHMLKVQWTKAQGWKDAEILPMNNFSIHPAAMVLHFAVENMETLKCYRGSDDKVRLFRPQYKIHRLNLGAERAALPQFDETDLLKCMTALIRTDINWVPPCGTGSLYLRPIIIGTQPTFQHIPPESALLYIICSPAPAKGMDVNNTGPKPGGITLLADPKWVRAWPGSPAEHKLGAMYGPTVKANAEAAEENCDQVLWLFGDHQELTEAGGMNLMIIWRDAKTNQMNLVTPSLEKGLILPGIIRKSILQLAKDYQLVDEIKEITITMTDIIYAINSDRLLEMFGCGTGATFVPIGHIYYKPAKKTLKIPAPTNEQSFRIKVSSILKEIQEGRNQKYADWCLDIEE